MTGYRLTKFVLFFLSTSLDLKSKNGNCANRIDTSVQHNIHHGFFGSLDLVVVQDGTSGAWRLLSGVDSEALPVAVSAISRAIEANLLARLVGSRVESKVIRRVESVDPDALLLVVEVSLIVDVGGPDGTVTGASYIHTKVSLESITRINKNLCC